MRIRFIIASELIRTNARMVCLPLLLLFTPTAAFAHSAERGLVMLLPTGFAITGGAVAVLGSFLLLSVIPASFTARLGASGQRLGRLPAITPLWTSLCSFLLLLWLLFEGFTGVSDPLANPLPLTIWTLWWVGFTLLQFAVGCLWGMLNPWYGMVRVTTALLRRSEPFFILPEAARYWPAITLFAGFGWFELIDIAPEEPGRLAAAVLLYWLVSFIGCLMFGYQQWMQYCEPFAIFFRLVGACSPLLYRWVESAREGSSAIHKQLDVWLVWPGQGFVQLPGLPLAGVLFVVLTLSVSSFDGLSETFAWFGLTGVNPLEFPGRSTVQWVNSVGLIGTFLGLAAIFMLSLFAGLWLLRKKDGYAELPLPSAAGRLVYSIVPIAIAFHLSHYLTLLLVNGQYALRVFNDPFRLGWELLGLTDKHQVTVSFLNNLHDVSIIWAAQTFIVAIGHIIGIVVAHCIALALFDHRAPSQPAALSSVQLNQRATISQIFLALLMVFYTVFGLWLLSTATVG